MLDQVTTTLVTGTHWIRPQSDGLRAFKQVQIDADLARKQSRIDARWAAVEFAEAKADFAVAASSLLGAWQKAERCGLTVQLDGYPFPRSLDEMVLRIQNWTERTSVEAAR
jgi:hypothetical protein